MPVLPSYRNQSIDLLCKSIDWFLCEGNTGLVEWVNRIETNKRTFAQSLISRVVEANVYVNLAFKTGRIFCKMRYYFPCSETHEQKEYFIYLIFEFSPKFLIFLLLRIPKYSWKHEKGADLILEFTRSALKKIASLFIVQEIFNISESTSSFLITFQSVLAKDI